MDGHFQISSATCNSILFINRLRGKSTKTTMNMKTAEEYLTQEMMDNLQHEIDDNNGVIDSDVIVKLLEGFSKSQIPVIKMSDKDLKYITVGDPWINVNKELPPRGVRVLLWQESGANCYGFLSGVSESTVKDNNDNRPTLTRNKVLHWSLGNDTPHDYDGKPHVTHWMGVKPPSTKTKILKSPYD